MPIDGPVLPMLAPHARFQPAEVRESTVPEQAGASAFEALVARFHLAIERVAEHEVEVVANEHEVARAKGAPNSARRVRHEQRAHTECVEHPHRKAGQRGVVPFIHMKATGQGDDGAPRQRSTDQHAGVADDRC